MAANARPARARAASAGRRRTPESGGMFPRHDHRAAGDHEAARRAPGRPPPQGARRHEALHALRRPPVLDLRRLPDRGHRPRRRAPRVRRRVRGRGLGEGHARAGRVRADGRPGRDERHERARLRAAEPLADARARRPRARDALGPGLAAGDRPRPVRAPAGQARHDRRDDRRDPRADRRCLGDGAARPHAGPTFIDFPLDHVFMEAEEAEPRRGAPAPPRPRPTGGCSTARSRCCATRSGR